MNHVGYILSGNAWAKLLQLASAEHTFSLPLTKSPDLEAGEAELVEKGYLLSMDKSFTLEPLMGFLAHEMALADWHVNVFTKDRAVILSKGSQCYVLAEGLPNNTVCVIPFQMLNLAVEEIAHLLGVKQWNISSVPNRLGMENQTVDKKDMLIALGALSNGKS